MLSKGSFLVSTVLAASINSLMLAQPAFAQAALKPSFIVQEIRVEGLHRIDPGTLFNYLPLKKGDQFTDEKATAAIHALYATGFFDDVRVTSEKNTVIVHIKERVGIASLDYSGIKEFNKDMLNKALGEINLAPGRYFNRSKLTLAEQELKKLYISRGFYAAEVNSTVTPLADDKVSLLFTVIEGPAAKIRQVNFIGNQVFSSSTLRDEMRLSTPNWFSWYSKNDLYSREKLGFDIENITAYYRDRGYLDFNINSTQVSISPDKKNMYLTLVLNEGKPYKVSSMTVEGELLGRDAEFQQMLTMRAGDTFSASKLKEANKAIADKLSEYGYTFATVDVEPELNKNDHTVALPLKIKTGRRVYVRRINIDGNLSTRDQVVRREIRQFESSWFDGSRVKLSQDRLNRTGYFNDVEINTVPVEGTNDQVDLNVKVNEARTGTANIGAGYSSADKVILSLAWSKENVFGSGTSISGSINNAKAFRTFEFAQSNPYFTDDGISRTTSVYYRTFRPLYYSSNDTDYRIRSYGTDVRFGVPFSEVDTVYFGLGYARFDIDVSDKTPSVYKDYVKRAGARSNVIPITVAWARDTRDSMLAPSRGYVTSVNLEVGTPIGSRYFKTDFKQQYYYSFGRGFTLALNGQFGYGKGYGNKPYPIFKNYYAGGIGSVRGYESNSLGPRDGEKEDRIGGSKQLIGNIELIVPLPGTGYDRTLRVFGFLDGGNVWAENENIRLASLRFSYGLGLTWTSPIGPLSFSFGFPITKKAGDKYDKFQFNIGASF